MRRWRSKGKVRRQQSVGLSKILYEEDLEQFKDYVINTNSNSIHSKCRKMICDLLLNSGLRESELCDLRVQDTPLVLHKSVVAVYIGKNEKDRDIPIPDPTAKALEDYIKNVRPKTLPRYVTRKDITKPVFYSQRKKPYTPAGIYYLIRKAGEAAHILKRVKPHMLRHTYATNMLNNGTNERELQILLGHSDIRTTLVYSHIINARMLSLANQAYQDFSNTERRLFK